MGFSLWNLVKVRKHCSSLWRRLLLDNRCRLSVGKPILTMTQSVVSRSWASFDISIRTLHSFTHQYFYIVYLSRSLLSIGSTTIYQLCANIKSTAIFSQIWVRWFELRRSVGSTLKGTGYWFSACYTVFKGSSYCIEFCSDSIWIVTWWGLMRKSAKSRRVLGVVDEWMWYMHNVMAMRTGGDKKKCNQSTYIVVVRHSLDNRRESHSLYFNCYSHFQRKF